MNRLEDFTVRLFEKKPATRNRVGGRGGLLLCGVDGAAGIRARDSAEPGLRPASDRRVEGLRREEGIEPC